jgi:hypothetical protein
LNAIAAELSVTKRKGGRKSNTKTPSELAEECLPAVRLKQTAMNETPSAEENLEPLQHITFTQPSSAHTATEQTVVCIHAWSCEAIHVFTAKHPTWKQQCATLLAPDDASRNSADVASLWAELAMDKMETAWKHYVLLSSMSASQLREAQLMHPRFANLAAMQKQPVQKYLEQEMKKNTVHHPQVFQHISSKLSPFERVILLGWRCEHFCIYRELNAVHRKERFRCDEVVGSIFEHFGLRAWSAVFAGRVAQGDSVVGRCHRCRIFARNLACNFNVPDHGGQQNTQCSNRRNPV